MIELIFATNNPNKVEEIQAVVGNRFRIITMKAAGIDIDIPEPHDTLEKNALEKSKTIFTITGKWTFAEDTGLEVNALGGEPGVRSARYAGDDKSFDKNIDKLLKNLEQHGDRTAQFRTVISLIFREHEYFFEGICKGRIEHERRGNQGFGYDPVFTPERSDKTFGQMSLEEKSKYSHRRKATDQLVSFLQSVQGA